MSSEKKKLNSMFDAITEQGASFLDLFSKQTEVSVAAAAARTKRETLQARNDALSQYWKMQERLTVHGITQQQRNFILIEMEKLEEEFGFGKPKAKKAKETIEIDSSVTSFSDKQSTGNDNEEEEELYS